MAIRVTMIAITIIISTSVNPIPRIRRLEKRLPGGIRCTVGGLLIALGVDVENVLPTPASRIRIVLHAAQPPFRGVSHRITGDAPEKFDLCICALSGAFYAVNQRFQTFGITESILLLRTKLIRIGIVFV